MIIRLDPKDLEKKLILLPHIYNVAVKRYGKEYCDKHFVKDKTAPRGRKNV